MFLIEKINETLETGSNNNTAKQTKPKYSLK